MVKYLRHIRCDFIEGLRRKSFESLLCEFVFALFEFEFDKSPSHDVAVLDIHFTDDPGRHMTSEKMLGFLTVYAHLNLDVFCRCDSVCQKRFFLDSIQQCFVAHADEYGWDKEHCAKTCNRILDSRFEFDRWWGARVKGSKSEFVAQIHITTTGNLSIGVFDKQKNLVAEQLIISMPQAPFDTLRAVCGEGRFGRPKKKADLVWVGDTRLRLWLPRIDRTRRDYWEYDFKANSLGFHFPRAEQGDPHGQYDLARIYLSGNLVPPDREKALSWLRLSAGQGFKHAIKLLTRLESQEKAVPSTENL